MNRLRVLIIITIVSAGTAYGAGDMVSAGFPFTIDGSQFVKDGKDVFLNIICYQPLEPDQELNDEIRLSRVLDDLGRWSAYKGGKDPIVLRVYPQPTPAYPTRLPNAFYDGIRELGFWIIRDIYFDQNFCDPNYIENGYRAVDAVIAEVKDANALDLIFAWEIGSEFLPDKTPCWNADVIEQFIDEMCSYLKNEIGKLERNGISNWVTWASYPPYDPLHTDDDPWEPEPNCLDYISYNVYSYWPEHICDHQAGPVTGTPYQGYLAALKKCYPSKAFVISETGLSDSNRAIEQGRLHPWYPAYRYGGMSPEQVAEGLVDRYWDARLLRDDKDPNIVMAGLAIFEWNDEWLKAGVANVDDQEPEEHFGICRFDKKPDGSGEYQLRYKLQQETIHDLYTLKFDHNATIIEDVIADNNSLRIGESTLVHAILSDSVTRPVRYRWEASRGYIVGDVDGMYDPNELGESNKMKFYAGKVALGPALITLAAIDANGNVDTASVTIDIITSLEPSIEILTHGTAGDYKAKASGRVSNVDLNRYKLICYLYGYDMNELSIQPFGDMKSIWINKEGYWWTRVHNGHDDELFCWLVPQDFNAPNKINNLPEPNWSPDCNYIAEANTVNMDPCDYNDVDNDLLLDKWERDYFGSIAVYDRYDDPDSDMCNNLEEFLRGTNPNDPNDDDKDGLWDNWEYHYFGDINLFDANDDPDSDGLTNLQEQNPNVGTHPGRASQDRDRDGLPDLWEISWFNTLEQSPQDDPDDDGISNILEYEFGLPPI